MKTKENIFFLHDHLVSEEFYKNIILKISKNQNL